MTSNMYDLSGQAALSTKGYRLELWRMEFSRFNNHAISGILKLRISVHMNENKYRRTNVLKSIDKQVFLCYNIISRK